MIGKGESVSVMVEGFRMNKAMAQEYMAKSQLSREVFEPYKKDNHFAHLRQDKIVEYRGSPMADVMFVGEAPGQHEQEQGLPFVGKSGKILDHVLQEVEIGEPEYYITNIVKFRPPENRDPTKDEVERSRAYLLKEISIVQPKLVVTLGRHPLSVFFNNLVVGQARGSILRYNREVKVPVFPTFHPQATVYDKERKKLFAQDMSAIARRLAEWW